MYKTTLLVVNVIFEGHARIIIKESCKSFDLQDSLAEREELPPFPLKFCISIAYKVKELSCTVSVPFFRTSTDHFLTLHDLKNTPEDSKQAEI